MPETAEREVSGFVAAQNAKLGTPAQAIKFAMYLDDEDDCSGMQFLRVWSDGRIADREHDEWGYWLWLQAENTKADTAENRENA